MKKLRCIIFLHVLLVWHTSSYGQLAIDRTTRFINLGVGFHGPAYHSGWHPAYLAGADFGILPNTTVGLTGSYYRYKITDSHKYSSYSAGGRASYYFNSILGRENKKLNYYAGMGVSYSSFSYSGLISKRGKVFVPGHIGARRMFGKNFGAFAEVGFNDVGAVKFGLTARL